MLFSADDAHNREQRKHGADSSRSRLQEGERFPRREFGAFEEQYHSGTPATSEAWAGSNHGQTLGRLLEIRGAGFKIESQQCS